MPELPEVETIVESLKPIIGSVIISVNSSDKKFRVNVPKNLQELIVGKQILNICRRSKYILICVSNELILVIHLGMSGRVLTGKNLDARKHDHLMITLDSQEQLIFNDPRRFGLYTVINTSEITSHDLFKDLGVEPLTDNFTAEYLLEVFKNRRVPIKALLMDAKIVVGVGNIYAAESLFRANIHPLKSANMIKPNEAMDLVKEIQAVLNEAIASGGSSLKDYVKASGEQGYFQHQFKVYGRKGKNCYNCDSQIQNVKLSGRSTFFCPNCQSSSN